MTRLFASVPLLLCTQLLFAQPQPNALPENKYIPRIKTIYYKLGDKNIPLKIFSYGESPGVVCINLHDNEETSVLAAGSVLETKGGVLIKIENNRQRVIRFRLRDQFFTFDPNRMFSRIGIEQSLRENRRFSTYAVDEIEKFANRLLGLIPDSNFCIVALHNNTNDAFGITSYLPGRIRQRDAKAVYADELEDMDDLALTTDSVLYERMAKSRYNTVWQDNQLAKKDGSLSIYCGEKQLRYINIETQHGKFSKYVEILERLLDILREDLKSSPNLD